MGGSLSITHTPLYPIIWLIYWQRDRVTDEWTLMLENGWHALRSFLWRYLFQMTLSWQCRVVSAERRWRMPRLSEAILGWMGCRAGFCGSLLNEMKLEALILGFVYMARHKAKSCWEGSRQRLGLKGLSSLVESRWGRLGMTTLPVKTLRRCQPITCWGPFGHCGAGRRLQEKRFLCTEQWCEPLRQMRPGPLELPGTSWGPDPSPPRMTHCRSTQGRVPPGEGLGPAKGQAHPSLVQGQRKKLIKSHHGTHSTMPEPHIVCRPYCLEKLSGFLRRKEQDFPGDPVIKTLVKAT